MTRMISVEWKIGRKMLQIAAGEIIAEIGQSRSQKSVHIAFKVAPTK